jgi:hypothetical protein
MRPRPAPIRRPGFPLRLLGLAVPALVLLAGCSSPAPDAGSTSTPEGSISSTLTITSTNYEVLPTEARVDYQLGGGYDPADGVGIVVRDSTDAPADGLYSICYINAFQTQPQEAELWLSERADLLLRDTHGDPVADPGWPDEMILDISNTGNRVAIAKIFGETIAGCASAGFDAVEFDNLDSWTRSDGALTEQNAVEMASALVDVAHTSGLAAGQKNSAELSERGRDEIGFDFAVTEECAQFDECDVFRNVYKDAVIDIEYTDALDRPFAEICDDPSTPDMTVLRDRDLQTPDSPEYVFEHC